VLQVAAERETKRLEVVLRALLLTSTSKTRHRFHLSTIKQPHLVVALALHVGVEIQEEEHLLTMQEALEGVAVEGLLSEGGPANEVEVKEEDGETGKK
jgi:hypothetical protein